MMLDKTLWATGALADAGDAVAGVSHDAGEYYALHGIEAFDGADDTLFLAHRFHR